MRISAALCAAALAGCASAAFGDHDSDVLAFHRRIKAIRRHARRAEASPPVYQGTTLVSSPNVVCPAASSSSGAFDTCAPTPALALAEMGADFVRDINKGEGDFNCVHD